MKNETLYKCIKCKGTEDEPSNPCYFFCLDGPKPFNFFCPYDTPIPEWELIRGTIKEEQE